MSLEQALADNTAAIRDLVAVWSKLSSTAQAVQEKAKPGDTIAAGGKAIAEVKAPKAEKSKEVAADPKPAAEPSTPEAPAAQTASSDEPATSVDYPTLQKAVFALAGKSREAAASVAASFGVKTFKELDASKWGDALAAVNDKLADLEAA
jgi:hypothetical protein